VSSVNDDTGNHVFSDDVSGGFSERFIRLLGLTVPSLSAAMTFPRAERDLLMFLASSNTAPSAPVLLTWTEALRIVLVRSVRDQDVSRGEQRDLLAARQVHQVQLPRQLQLRLHVLLLDVDEEDAVAARAVLVHVCGRSQKKRRKPLQEIHDRKFKASPDCLQREDVMTGLWNFLTRLRNFLTILRNFLTILRNFFTRLTKLFFVSSSSSNTCSSSR